MISDHRRIDTDKQVWLIWGESITESHTDSATWNGVLLFKLWNSFKFFIITKVKKNNNEYLNIKKKLKLRLKIERLNPSQTAPGMSDRSSAYNTAVGCLDAWRSPFSQATHRLLVFSFPESKQAFFVTKNSQLKYCKQGCSQTSLVSRLQHFSLSFSSSACLRGGGCFLNLFKFWCKF